MCKRLADILFPLNILGNKVRCITYPTPFTPESYQTDSSLDLAIEFEGKRFELRYTKYSVYIHTRTTQPITIISDGDFTETITVASGRRGRFDRPIEQEVYIKCVGAKKLIINGEQII